MLEDNYEEEETLEEELEDSEELEEDSEGLDGEIPADAVDELKEEVEQAIEEGASKEEVKQMIKEFELKVNGKTIKRSVNLSDDEEMTKILQREAAGQRAMQESAELKKLYDSEIARLKSNPWEVLKELEMDPDELAEERIRQRVEELKKSPEQRERDELRREIEQLRKQQKDREEGETKQKQEHAYTQAAAELQDEIMEALNNDSYLPNSPKTVSKIADALLWAETNGFPGAKVVDVLPAVKAEIKREMAEFFKDKPAEFLEEFVGKQTLEKQRKERLEKMKKVKQPKISETAKASKSDGNKQKKIQSKDFFKNLGREN